MLACSMHTGWPAYHTLRKIELKKKFKRKPVSFRKSIYKVHKGNVMDTSRLLKCGFAEHNVYYFWYFVIRELLEYLVEYILRFTCICSGYIKPVVEYHLWMWWMLKWHDVHNYDCLIAAENCQVLGIIDSDIQLPWLLMLALVRN